MEGLLLAGTVHTQCTVNDSYVSVRLFFVIQIPLIRSFNPFPFKSNYEVSTVLVRFLCVEKIWETLRAMVKWTYQTDSIFYVKNIVLSQGSKTL